jgi:UDP-glucose:glycoprotein glucosyltransferase
LNFFIFTCRSKSAVYKSDHHYPGVVDEDSIIILYGSLGTTSFTAFHTELKKLAEDGKIDYIVRHYVKVKLLF